MRRIFTSSIVLFLVFLNTLQAKTWLVGAARTYTKPSQVANLVGNGDTIFIDGGVYLNDAVKWTKKNLCIIGSDDLSNRSILRFTGLVPNGKGIFVFETKGACDNATVENIVFDGAQIADVDGANAAGIRFQAENLTVRNCKFMNCQNGILEGNSSVTSSNVYILHSEFENNGYQLPNDPTYSGYEHHIYIGASTDTLWVEGNWFHHPRGQANSLKTRAQRSYILYNYIDEEATGYGSWEINIAQGGLNVIMGNVIIQGQSGPNHGIIGYDATTNALEDFYFVNNTVINKFKGAAKYFNIVPGSGIQTFKVYNNIFSTCTGSTYSFFNGNVPSVLDSAANIIDMDYLSFGFLDPNNSIYLIDYSTAAAIDKGVNAGVSSEGFSLVPTDIPPYGNSMQEWPRLPYGLQVDLGAYEFIPPIGIQQARQFGFEMYPNPVNDLLTIQVPAADASVTWTIYNLQGQTLMRGTCQGLLNTIDVKDLVTGFYFLQVNCGIQQRQRVFSKP